ncbi:MAG: caspase family protein [Proteobacteria bacterium]|nr:caspase family protein [Pseudomonadota bacterium]
MKARSANRIVFRDSAYSVLQKFLNSCSFGFALTVLFLGVCAGSEASAAEAIQKTRKATLHLITAGISNFEDPFWPALKWAESDASALLQNFGNETEFKTVKTSLSGAKATLAEVRRQLAEIQKNAAADDVVLFYISSHGTLKMGPANSLEPVIVLHDTLNRNLARTSLSHAELRRWMDSLRPRRKALILATCHSGAGKSRYTPEVAEFRRGEKGTQIRSLDKVSEGTVILAASSRNETALESDELKADVYSHFLLEALTAGDKNSDGAVSILEAHDYAKTRTYIFTQGRQRPTLEAEFIGDGDFPLKGQRKGDGRPVLEAYSQRFEGYSIGIAKGAPVELPFAIPLQNGDNEVTVYSPDDSEPRTFALKAGAGEIISLQKVLAPHPFYVSLSPSYERADDAKFKKLTGSSGYFSHGLIFGGRITGWDLNAAFNFHPTLSHKVRPNLTARLTSKRWVTGISKAFDLSRRFSFLAGIQGYLALSTLTLQDMTTQESLSAESKSYAWGWLGESNIKILTSLPLRISLGVGQNFETRAFGLFGALPMNSKFVRTGLHWEFGSPAKEL